MELTLTEERNPLTSDIDTLPTLDMLTLINAKTRKWRWWSAMNFPTLPRLWMLSPNGCGAVGG